MTIDNLPPADSLETAREIDRLCDRYEEALARGETAALCDWLPAAEPLRAAALVELVRIELEHRLRSGEAARAEEYLARYPALAEDADKALRIIVAEFRTRRLGEPGLHSQEYARRFPQLVDHPAWSGLHLVTTPQQPPTHAMPSGARRVPDVPGYKVLEELGRGGMGVVYKAVDPALKRTVALKMILDGGHAEPVQRERFRIEAEAAAGLDHPNVVPVHGVGVADGQPYLVMRWMEGGSLSARLADFRQAPREAAGLVAKVARAAHYAHQRGILHRDVKPGNILLDPAGEPHLGDFGLARRVQSDNGLTATGAVVGSAEYMAPEQARGSAALTVAADVYALGAVLYALLTGRPPFTGSSHMDVFAQVLDSPPPSTRALNPCVDADLEAVCLKCLEKSPEERYPSAAALAEDLERYVHGEGVTARPPGLWDWLLQAARTRPPQSPDYNCTRLVWMGVSRLAFDSAIFVLVQAGWSVAWVWLTVGLSWAAFGLLIWLGSLRRFRHLATTRRHSAMIGVGLWLASIALVFAYVPLDAGMPARAALGIYPALGGLGILMCFALGSTHWSRFYLLGLFSLPLVPALAWWPDVAPLLYGFNGAAIMWYWAYALARTFGGRAAKA